MIVSMPSWCNFNVVPKINSDIIGTSTLKKYFCNLSKILLNRVICLLFTKLLQKPHPIPSNKATSLEIIFGSEILNTISRDDAVSWHVVTGISFIMLSDVSSQLMLYVIIVFIKFEKHIQWNYYGDKFHHFVAELTN